MVDIFINHTRSFNNLLSNDSCNNKNSKINKHLSTDNVNKQLEDYKNYLVDQKDLIKKIHQQQKKLKTFRHHSRAGSNSKSCYFQNGVSSMPPPQTRNQICSQSFRLPPKPDPSMNNLEWYPNQEFQTSYTFFDYNSNSYLSQLVLKHFYRYIFVQFCSLFLPLSRLTCLPNYSQSFFLLCCCLILLNSLFKFIIGQNFSRLKSKKRH
jgi:hypothetical protein